MWREPTVCVMSWYDMLCEPSFGGKSCLVGKVWQVWQLLQVYCGLSCEPTVSYRRWQMWQLFQVFSDQSCEPTVGGMSLQVWQHYIVTCHVSLSVKTVTNVIRHDMWAYIWWFKLNSWISVSSVTNVRSLLWHVIWAYSYWYELTSVTTDTSVLWPVIWAWSWWKD